MIKNPKLAPVSMSVWRPSDSPRWRWSIHEGSKVVKRGSHLKYHNACNAASAALDKVVQAKYAT